MASRALGPCCRGGQQVGAAQCRRSTAGSGSTSTTPCKANIQRCQPPLGVTGRDVSEGGEGVGWDPPPPWVPLWSPPTAGQNVLSSNPLGTEGAEAKFWLSAANIGRGGGGAEGGPGGGGGAPPAVYGRSDTSLGPESHRKDVGCAHICAPMAIPEAGPCSMQQHCTHLGHINGGVRGVVPHGRVSSVRHQHLRDEQRRLLLAQNKRCIHGQPGWGPGYPNIHTSKIHTSKIHTSKIHTSPRRTDHFEHTFVGVLKKKKKTVLRGRGGGEGVRSQPPGLGGWMGGFRGQQKSSCFANIFGFPMKF